MRIAFVVIGLCVASACTSSTGPTLSISGQWTLLGASQVGPPLRMTLTQTGHTFTGAGSAMGVDVPIPVTISGTVEDFTRADLVSMTMSWENGGGVVGQFQGALLGDTLSGSTTFYGFSDHPVTGTASFLHEVIVPDARGE